MWTGATRTGSKKPPVGLAAYRGRARVPKADAVSGVYREIEGSVNEDGIGSVATGAGRRVVRRGTAASTGLRG